MQAQLIAVYRQLRWFPVRLSRLFYYIFLVFFLLYLLINSQVFRTVTYNRQSDALRQILSKISSHIEISKASAKIGGRSQYDLNISRIYASGAGGQHAFNVKNSSVKVAELQHDLNILEASPPKAAKVENDLKGLPSSGKEAGIHRDLKISTTSIRAAKLEHDLKISTKISAKAAGIQYNFTLRDDKKAYFTNNNGTLCSKVGGVPDMSGICKCRPGWWGAYCSYPKAIEKDLEINWSNIKPRDTPRRIIYAVPFNLEFDMTEIRLHELGEVVDLFVFGESNFSSHGDPKEQRLLNALNDGFMREYHNKILYVFLDHFDPKGISDGWVSEALQRNNIGLQGLRLQIFGLKPDDLFIITDADEIPQEDALIFLKNHNGYPEPFGFTLHPYYYTFYWKNPGYAQIRGGCTMGMVRNVMEYNVYQIRSFRLNNNNGKLRSYTKLANTTTVRPWIMGGGRRPVGWHCSSCTNPKDIKEKMMSAQNGDFPRWGDFPEKMNEEYIRTLIILGLYFDEKKKLLPSMMDEADLPRYVTQNRDRFSYLLDTSYYGKPDMTLLGKSIYGHIKRNLK